MPMHRRRPALVPRVDALEGRALLSTLAAPHRPTPALVAAAQAHRAQARAQLQARRAATLAAHARVQHAIQPRDVRFVTSDAAAPLATGASAPYKPVQVRHAYGIDALPTVNGLPNDGAGTTIAIVDANDDPNIAADLKAFDAQFGLPDPTFTKVNQTGGTRMPRSDPGWALEIALDVEWAHAIAPKANILLVEANSSAYSDMLTAVDYAKAHADVVSNSYGSSEFSAETSSSYDGHFVPSTRPVAFTVASGDNGAPAGWPGVAPGVLAVGGTTLPLDASGNRISNEVAWSGSGGGVSPYEPAVSYQSGVGYTAHRANPDVAYNADSNTGFYVYDSVRYNGGKGWWAVGGTSAGAPQWAGLIALADQGRATPLSGSGLNTLLYAVGPSSGSYSTYFTDITAGSNGNAATTGFDLATGLGTPKADQLVPYLRTN